MKDYLRKHKEDLETIRKAALEGKLVLFVGAGLSYNYCVPNWGQLANSLIKRCNDDKVILNEEKYYLLSSSFTDIQKISIIKEKYESHKKTKKYYTALYEELDTTKKGIKKNIKNTILKVLNNIGCKIITTNADNSFETDKYFKKKEICKNVRNLKDIKTALNYDVIHLHGSILDNASLVFSADDYANFYSDQNVIGLLTKTFKSSDWVFLFTGYGLGDAELVRYIAGNGVNKDMTNAYILQGYYSHQEILENCYRDYYKRLGIKQISYNLDENEYGQEIYILKEISDCVSSIRNRENSQKSYKDIVASLKRIPNDDSIKIVKNGLTSEKNYMVDLILKSPFNLQWLIKLMTSYKSYFKAENNLKAGIVEDGSIKTNPWNGLKLISEIFELYPNDTFLKAGILKILNDSFKILSNNKEIRNNFGVVHTLLDLYFSDIYFIENCKYNFVDAINLMFEIPFIDVNDILYQLKINFYTTINIDDDSYLKGIKIIFKKILKDPHGYIDSDGIYERLIKDHSSKRPYEYYQLFLDCFSELLDRRIIMASTIGSFDLYPDEDSLADDEIKLVIGCLKNTINILNISDVKRAISLLNKKKKNTETYKKISAYILGVHFSSLDIKDYKELLEDEDIYTEVCCLLLKNSSMDPESKETIEKEINNLNIDENDKIDYINCLYGREPTQSGIDPRSFKSWKNRNKHILTSGAYDFKDNIKGYAKKIESLNYSQIIDYYNKSLDYDKFSGLSEACCNRIISNFIDDVLGLKSIQEMPDEILRQMLSSQIISNENYLMFVNKIFLDNKNLKKNEYNTIFYMLRKMSDSDETLIDKILNCYLNFNLNVLFTREDYVAYENDNIQKFLSSLPCTYFDALYYIARKHNKKNYYLVLENKLNEFINKNNDLEVSDSIIAYLFNYLEIIYRGDSEKISKILSPLSNKKFKLNYCLLKYNAFFNSDRYLMLKGINSFYDFLFGDLNDKNCEEVRFTYYQYIIGSMFYKPTVDDTYDKILDLHDFRIYDWIFYNQLKSDNYSIATKEFFEYINSIQEKPKEIEKQESNPDRIINILSKFINKGNSDKVIWDLILKFSKDYSGMIGNDFKILMDNYISTNEKACFEIYKNIIHSYSGWETESNKVINILYDWYKRFTKKEKNEIYKELSLPGNNLTKLINKIDKGNK